MLTTKALLAHKKYSDWNGRLELIFYNKLPKKDVKRDAEGETVRIEVDRSELKVVRRYEIVGGP